MDRVATQVLTPSVSGPRFESPSNATRNNARAQNLLRPDPQLAGDKDLTTNTSDKDLAFQPISRPCMVDAGTQTLDQPDRELVGAKLAMREKPKTTTSGGNAHLDSATSRKASALKTLLDKVFPPDAKQDSVRASTKWGASISHTAFQSGYGGLFEMLIVVTSVVLLSVVWLTQ